jgi:hypothetical protein
MSKGAQCLCINSPSTFSFLLFAIFPNVLFLRVQGIVCRLHSVLAASCQTERDDQHVTSAAGGR